MTAATRATSADEAIASLRDALDAVRSVNLHAISEAELVSFCRELEALTRQVPSVVARADATLADRSVPASYGYRDDAALLAATHRLTRSQANARSRLVSRVVGTTSLCGERVPPTMPATADALAAGSVTLDHVEVIAKALARLPEHVRCEHGERAELLLVTHACELSARDLEGVAQRLVDTLHPDGDSPDDGDIRRAGRHASLHMRPDGWGELKARLSPTALALWQTILTPLVRADHDDSNREDADQGEAGATPTCPDLRSRSEKLHDALEEAGRRVLAASDLPSTAGLPTTLMVTVALTDLEERVGRATTVHGGTLTINEVIRLAVDARLIPVVLGDAGEVLAHGRGRRLASVPQRRALFARDRGCSFPGCAKPASESEIHHAPAWIDGGLTDIDSMTVTCGYHQNEAPRQGWDSEVVGGIAWWIPPEHIDPNRTPRRNPVWNIRLRT